MKYHDCKKFGKLGKIYNNTKKYLPPQKNPKFYICL